MTLLKRADDMRFGHAHAKEGGGDNSAEVLYLWCIDIEEFCTLARIAAGETGREPAPKEQPPRKLSGR